MKTVLMFSLFIVFALSACTSEKVSAPKAISTGILVGADIDEHQCIGSAGYLWCAKLKQCVRPWELAAQKNFQNTAQSFKDYCEK